MPLQIAPPFRKISLVLSVLAILSVAAATGAEEFEPIRPPGFGIILNFGYAGDHFPQDDATFEKVIVGAKEAHFNVVLCQWSDARAEICQRHGMKIMVDLLAPAHHVYKSADATEALLKRIKDNDVIYAYHLWSDQIGSTHPGRTRDVGNVHQWDPNHAAYVGDRNMREAALVKNLDLIGYYDFQWFRGGHWRHLNRALTAVQKSDAYLLRYTQANPGRIGAGNPNRAGWTIATSVPFGLKGYTYHYPGGLMNRQTGALDGLGQDLKKVNAGFLALGPAIMELGNPQAVYSTPVTKTNKDRPTGQPEPTVPGELQAIPADAGFQITSGEVVVGVFEPRSGQTALALASHNAYQEQPTTIALPEGAKDAEIFDLDAKAWVAAEIGDAGLQIIVPPYTPSLVRWTR